ncbi:MAG: hypothetical protein ABSG20_13670 [Bradyrhizobium sp.]
MTILLAGGQGTVERLTEAHRGAVYPRRGFELMKIAMMHRGTL